MARVTQEVLERIWREVAAIPRGKVESYGGIASRAGLPRRARLVGHALRVAPEELQLPWHRVVNAAGRISLPAGSAGHALQRRLLEAEGVLFRGDRVIRAPTETSTDLDELLWAPPPARSRRQPR